MNILIVDDDLETADLLEASLSLWGYSASKANNGIQALEMLRQNSYDVVITDAQMPGMSGFELCKEIRSRWPQMFIIGITGALEVTKFREAGANVFFRKPFHLDELPSILKNIQPPSKSGT